MNETRRKPTTRTRCPNHFDKWHGIFYYAQSHRQTQPLFTQSWITGGGGQSVPAQGKFELPTCWSTVELANHQTTVNTMIMGQIHDASGIQRGRFQPAGQICMDGIFKIHASSVVITKYKHHSTLHRHLE